MGRMWQPTGMQLLLPPCTELLPITCQGGSRGTSLYLSSETRSVRHKPLCLAVSYELCLLQGTAARALRLFRFQRGKDRVRSLNSSQFSSNRIFQLLIESQYLSPFFPKQSSGSSEGKKRACQISSSISSNLQARIDLGQ